MKNWICEKKADITLREKNRHTLYRKTFTVNCADAQYTLKITADDYYKLYINGNFVGQGPAPSYYFAYNFNEYDISKYINEGINVIAVHCYYHGVPSFSCTSGDGRCGMFAELQCNRTTLILSDASWRYALTAHFLPTAKLLGYSAQFSEEIDLNYYMPGWNEIDFDDRKWKAAVLNEADDHVPTPQITPSVVTREVHSVSVNRIADDSFVLDFGKEITACIKMNVTGTQHSNILLRFGEELNADGSVRFKMRCNVDYEENWILSGRNDVFENYDYKGFRYLQVQSADKAVTPECFSAAIRHYPIHKKIDIKINDEKLAQIWNICENAVIISAQEGFLDCPTREKGQYLGDMTVTAPAHTYITGNSLLYKKALTDFANSLQICEGMSAVAPGGNSHSIADFSLLYPYQLLKYYNLTGDTAVVRELFSAAKCVMDYFKQYERSDGLLETVSGKWNLVDWPENMRDGYDFDLSIPVSKGCHNVTNAYYYGAMQCMNELCKIVGKREEYNCAKFEDSFISTFYSTETGLFTDSEVSTHSSLHSNALPLFFGMVKKDAAECILDWIEGKDLVCGVFFSYFVLKTLTRYGRHQKAYELITSECKNSWSNMINEGATACFEAWGKEQKKNISLCHPWACAPIILLIEDFAGLKLSGGIANILPAEIPALSGRAELMLNNSKIVLHF